MKTIKTSIVLVFILFNLKSYGQIKAAVWSKDGIENIIAKHKTVAILPFEYHITYNKLPKNSTEEDIRKQEKESSKSLQTSMHSYLLNKSDNYTVEFQDVRKTNGILLKNNIGKKELAMMNMDEVAKLLEVDGIIQATFTSDSPVGTGAAAALAFLLFWAPTNQTDGYISIYDGATGDLIFKYTKETKGGLGSSADDCADRIMKKLSASFPYKKPGK